MAHSKSKDPFTLLQTMDFCMSETMYIKDMASAAQASRQYANLQQVMTDLELQNL